MGSGLFNVIYIKLVGFILLGHFCELFEMLTTVENWRQIALHSPQPESFTLKPRPKPTRRNHRGAMGLRSAQAQFSTPAAGRWFHLTYICGIHTTSDCCFDAFPGPFAGRAARRRGRQRP